MRLPLLLAAALLAAPAPAQQKRPMTFADLQAMHRIADPQISPSGKWILFSVTDVSLEKNTKINHLWIVPLDGSSKERQLTTGPGESNGRFSPNGAMISMSMSNQIYIAHWNDATGTLDEPKEAFHVPGGAGGALWSPDSKRFLYVSSVYPECSLDPGGFEDACSRQKDEEAAANPVKAQIWDHLLYRHWNAYTGQKRSHLWVADIDGRHYQDLTNEEIVGDAEVPTFSLGGPLGYAWAPDGKEIAYVVNLNEVPAESTNNDIFIQRLDQYDSKPVRVSKSPGSDDGPQYSPDGKYLAWRSQARPGFESDRFRLAVMDRASGMIKTDVMPGYTDMNKKVVRDNWVDEFAWAPDSKRIAYASPDRGRVIVTIIPIATYPGSVLAGWSAISGDLGSVAFTPEGAIVATRMSVDGPAEIAMLQNAKTLEKGYDVIQSETKITSLTHLNAPVVSQLDFAKMESFTFPGANDIQVQGFLIRPPNFDPSKKYPLKFLIHGGPQGAWGDAWSYRWNPELFAANGYVVVMINPRGSTGYGQQFVDEVSGDWGGRPYIDLMKGLDYAEAKYPFIDKTRECALGASYGGFMANWILTHTTRFACIVTHDGMYNPQSAFGTTEELWFNEWEFRPLVGTGPHASAAAHATVDQTHPAHPWDFANLPASQDPFRKFSPMLAIQNAKTPTLVIHSQLDYRLDVSEGFQLFTALQLLHVPSKMLYFPDEGHWVLKPQNSQLWYTTVNDWVDQWTHTNAYEKK